MSYLTVFSTPKSFENPHIYTIQRNAIESWTRLGTDIDVQLIGNEVGTSEVALELGIKHIPDVLNNQEGTPLISSIFETARRNSSSHLLAFFNTDMLFTQQFMEIIRTVDRQSDKFLIVGQRVDLDIRESIEFSDKWEEQLETRISQDGKKHPPAGSDFFVFPRDLFSEIPDLAVGRAGWDNWMIFHAVTMGWDVVDITPTYMPVHQNHDYSHLPNGRPHYKLEESKRNVNIAGGEGNMYTILEVPLQLQGNSIQLAKFDLIRSLRKLEIRMNQGDSKVGLIRKSMAKMIKKLRKTITAIRYN